MTRSNTNTPAAADHRSPAWVIVLAACAIGLALVVWSLSALRLDHVLSVEAGRSNLRELVPFWIATGLLWAALTALWWQLAGHCQHTSLSLKQFARTSCWIIVLAGTARGVVLFTHEPTLSDDVYRYIFDGRNLVHGINPYLPVPAERAHADKAHWSNEQAVAARVNHPALTTIYLPMSQWVFAGSALLISDSFSDPDSSAQLFRIVFTVFDIGVIFVLLAILFHQRRSPWWAALYAWHPLPITEIAGSGHQDAVGMAMLLLGVYLFLRATKKAVQWTAPLALSALVKPIAVPIALIMLKGQRWRTWFTSAATAAVVGIIVAGPLLFSHNGQPLENLRDTSERFSMKWAHFGAAFDTILAGVEWATQDAASDSVRRPSDRWTREDHQNLARIICAAIVLACIVMILAARLDSASAALAIMLAMLVFSTTVHPWYVLWALPFVPLTARGWIAGAAWMLSLTILLNYAAWGYVITPTGALTWTAPTWSMAFGWLPVYAALLIGIVRVIRRMLFRNKPSND